MASGALVSTIRDIARAAGVSVSTASLAMNEDRRVRPETRARVLAAAAELDFHPMRAARTLSSGRSWSIHLLHPSFGDTMSSGFFTRFLSGLHDRCRDGGYALAITVSADEREACHAVRRLMAERSSDGVVLMNPTEHDDLLEAVVEARFPHVLLGRSPRPGVTSVDNDNVRAGSDAAAHLIAGGRRTLLLVNGPAYRTFTQDRALGFERACAEAGAAGMVIHVDGPPEASSAAVRAHLGAGYRLDGIVAVSDPQAVAVMRALQELDLRVPDDVAVIGMNDDDVARFTTPRLSSVDLGAAELGRCAAELLLGVIEGSGAVGEHRTVPHALAIRESSP
jgi:DNA-binding LacI/PurR family transcriptional regulator